MSVSFLTPWAAVIGMAALLGVGLLLLAERRSRRLCVLLGLSPRRGWSLAADAAGLIGVAALLSLALAQPVVSQVRPVGGRVDAEAIAVFDISRSMLARGGPRAETRLARARALAKELRSGIPQVPMGVSSLTDRLLPHLFPTLSANAFAATVDRAIGIERPVPDRRSDRATALGALGDLGRQNFFGRAARARVAVVFTDGESVPFSLRELRAVLLGGRVAVYFVHTWDAEERVYGPQGAERYRPDPRSRPVLDRLATEIGGAVFTENEAGPALSAIRARLGDGRVAPRGRELQAVVLAPYAVAAALVPLALVLLRRNF